MILFGVYTDGGSGTGLPFGMICADIFFTGYTEQMGYAKMA